MENEKHNIQTKDSLRREWKRFGYCVFLFVLYMPKLLIFHKSIIFDIKCMIFCITDMIFGKEKV